MSITEALLAPVTQPGGLYPDSPPRIKKQSKGSKLNRQKKPNFNKKRPELPPIAYHVTPYENPDNPPEYKRTGGRFWKVESRKYKVESESKTPFAGYKDFADCVRKNKDKDDPEAYCGQIKHQVEDKKKRTKDSAQTPRQQKGTPSLQPKEPLMRMTTPDGKGDPGRQRNYVSPFPDRNPNVKMDNPANLTLEELRQRERKAHPDLSDEEIDNLVKFHIRELGEPSHKEHQEDYKRAHPNASRMLHFGVNTGIPISHRFKAVGLGDSGDIKLIGTFLDYEKTTNGWHIDPSEESNIVEAPLQSNVTVRVAHSKEPERVVGKYTKFQANEDDGCIDAYGNPLGRHIDFEAVVNPQDAQLRTNILKGWVNDMSPGLDAEVFCSECNESWGLDQATNKLVKTCEHQDAEGILRNIKPKEGSIVTEPAFEGRTQFHPTFTFGMAMNQLFSPDEYESEPVGTRVSPNRAGGRQPMNRRQTKTGGIKMTQIKLEGSDASKLATTLYNHGFFTANETKQLQKLHFLKAEDDDEDEDTGEDEDEDARIRAAFPLIKKALSRNAQYMKSLKGLLPSEDEDRMEDQHKYAEDRSEDEDEDEDRMEDEDEDRAEDSAPDQEGPIKTPGDPHRDLHDLGPANKPKVSYGSGGGKGLGPGQLGGMKLMSKEERATVLEAQKILAHAEKDKLLGEANAILAKQQLRKDMTILEAARKRFEQEKDMAGVKAVDEHIAKIKAQLEPKVDKTVQGAQAAPSTPQITTPPKTQGVTPHAFRAAFNAEMLPILQANPRFRGLQFKEGMVS